MNAVLRYLVTSLSTEALLARVEHLSRSQLFSSEAQVSSHGTLLADCLHELVRRGAGDQIPALVSKFLPTVSQKDSSIYFYVSDVLLQTSRVSPTVLTKDLVTTKRLGLYRVLYTNGFKDSLPLVKDLLLSVSVLVCCRPYCC